MDNNDILHRAINKATKYNSRFFVYRMPDENKIHFGAEINSELLSNEEFYIHPFENNTSTPFCKIANQMDEITFLESDSLPSYKNKEFQITTTDKEIYLSQVNDIINKINKGIFNKVVLSNTLLEKLQIEDNTISNIFFKLHEKYPSAFVFLYNTPDTGMWMGASPERFLQYKDGEAETMALAGTRLVDTNEDWNDKEIFEQQIVCDYIAKCFDQLLIPYSISHKYTRKAGPVEHLCNDIKSSNITSNKIKELTKILHPTPAVAGIPTQEAIKYLSKLERHERRYYGGYIGPKCGNNFSFFVNLRSMQIIGNNILIYVGGGITKDSIAIDEWNEIKNKSNTLINIIKD